MFKMDSGLTYHHCTMVQPVILLGKYGSRIIPRLFRSEFFRHGIDEIWVITVVHFIQTNEPLRKMRGLFILIRSKLSPYGFLAVFFYLA